MPDAGSAPPEGASRRRHGYRQRVLPLSSINVLRQHRETFEDDLLESLALSLSRDGLFNPLLVARLTSTGAAILLAFVNEHYRLVGDQAFVLDALHATWEGEEEIYYVLIAGERRYRSCRLMYANGQIDEAKWRSRETRSLRFWAHLRRGTVSSYVVGNIGPDVFMALQFKENSYLPPHPEEQARGYWSWYQVRRCQEPGLSVAAFAQEVNRKSDTMRDLFRFLKLPESVRLATRRRGGVSYTVALELGRLQRLCADSRTFDEFFARARLEQPTVKRFAGWIDDWYEERKAGQTSLLGLLYGADESDFVRRRLRRVVDRRIATDLARFHEFQETVRRFFAGGQLGYDTSPFSTASVARALLSLLNLLGTLIPLVHGDLTRRERREVEVKLRELEPLAQEIQDVLDRDEAAK